MPDITMCINKDCPIRSVCYRYRAKPSDWQSFAKFNWKMTPEPDFDPDEPDCDYFWECRDRFAKHQLVSTEDADERNKYVAK